MWLSWLGKDTHKRGMDFDPITRDVPPEASVWATAHWIWKLSEMWAWHRRMG